MPQHKRNLPSEAERAVPAPSAKKTKLPLAAEMPTPTTLEEAIKIIDMFKAEQAALVKHISRTDADFLNAPSYIKALMLQGEEGLSVLAAGIRKNMRSASRELDEEMESAGYKRGAVTWDDFSQAMVPFIKEIKNLIDGNKGDQLTRLRTGYELLFELKSFSQPDEPDTCVSYGDRPSDEEADDLLSDVARRRKEAGDAWDWKKDLEDLEREAKYNGGYGVEPWYPMSIETLSLFVAGACEAA
ncbi:hypothetical protein V8F20_012474 [Naviculisporaceae sp. PSN 640]